MCARDLMRVQPVECIQQDKEIDSKTHTKSKKKSKHNKEAQDFTTIFIEELDKYKNKRITTH